MTARSERRVVVTKLRRDADGVWRGRASVGGHTREFERLCGSWSRAVNRRFPEDRELPRSVARREALPLIARALQSRLPRSARAAR